jgi:hypothetical protein
MEIDDQQIDEVGGNILLDVADNFSDPDGDDLSFEAVSSATGTATVVVSGSVLLITGVDVGTDTITVTASDGTLSAEDKFVVTVGNLPPEVTTEIDDQHIQTAGETILLNVAGNFTDPNGDTLSFAAVSSATGTTVSVINVSVLVITGVEVGTTAITVTASDTDTDGSTAVDTFDVTVGNRAPEAEEIPDTTVVGGALITLDVSTYFSDLDDDVLTFTAETDATGIALVAVNGSILTIIGGNPGTATITVTATDPDEATAQDAFEVKVTAAGG